jgi:hypothetical protein
LNIPIFERRANGFNLLFYTLLDRGKNNPRGIRQESRVAGVGGKKERLNLLTKKQIIKPSLAN